MTEMFSLEGRTAAVVGSGSGIGEAVAIGCAEAGAYVSCLDIDADAAARTADHPGGFARRSAIFWTARADPPARSRSVTTGARVFST